VNDEAASMVADATRRALDELDDFPPDSELRAVVVVFDVQVPDEDDPAEPFTHTVWKVAPVRTSSSLVYGMLSTGAHALMFGGMPR
jgi:hypothetical protein